MGKGPEETLPEGGHTDVQQTYAEVLDVTNRQGNVN